MKILLQKAKFLTVVFEKMNRKTERIIFELLLKYLRFLVKISSTKEALNQASKINFLEKPDFGKSCTLIF